MKHTDDRLEILLEAAGFFPNVALSLQLKLKIDNCSGPHINCFDIGEDGNSLEVSTSSRSYPHLTWSFDHSWSVIVTQGTFAGNRRPATVTIEGKEYLADLLKSDEPGVPPAG